MKKTNSLVEVALAVYNGSLYLPEFLESLRLQTNQDWSLIARDDVSSDASVNIVEKWGSINRKVRLIKNDQKNFGVIGNFSKILSSTQAKYVMLADQDDVWCPDKIGKSLAKIIELEKTEHGEVCPALVFSDLHVVDDKLNLVNSSFIKMQGLDKLQQPSFIQLLTQNVAPGCTMIVNRALLDLALPIPQEVAMHDWWLIQVASLFGRIGYIDEPTIAYRQHGSNQVGAISRDVFSIFQDILNGGRLYKKRILNAQLQARVLIARYDGMVKDSDLAAATTFANLSELCIGYRQFLAWKRGLRKSGFIRNIGFYCLM